jgi:uncharacterized protein YeeX (DUF496 family)
MKIGQGIVDDVRAVFEKRVGEYLIAKSRMVGVNRRIETMRGDARYDEYLQRSANIANDATMIDADIERIQGAARRGDWTQIIGAVPLYGRLSAYIGSVNTLARDVGLVDRSDESVAPWIAAVGLVVAMLMLRRKREGLDNSEQKS